MVIFINSTSTENLDDATISGYVWDETFEIPAENFTIEITGKFFLGNSTTTNRTGFYKLSFPAGEITLTISKKDMVFEKHDLNIQPSENTQMDFTISQPKAEDKSDPFSLFTFEHLAGNIYDYWYLLVIIIVLLITVSMILSIIDKTYEKVDHRKYKLFDENSVESIEETVRYIFLITMVIIIARLLVLIFPGIDETI